MELEMIKSKKTEQKSSVQYFVDSYTDEQIQEIISIFRNDFKPPKNLWIEKQPASQALQIPSHGSGQSTSSLLGQNTAESSSPDFFQDIYVEAIEQFNNQQMVLQQKQ